RSDRAVARTNHVPLLGRLIESVTTKYPDSQLRCRIALPELSGMPAPFPEFGEEYVQIAASEGPLERFGGPLVAGQEGHHVPLQIGQALEVTRCEQLALNDREVNLDLVEPTGVNRS